MKITLKTKDGKEVILTERVKIDKSKSKSHLLDETLAVIQIGDAKFEFDPDELARAIWAMWGRKYESDIMM